MARTEKMTGTTAKQVGEIIEKGMPIFTKAQLLKSQRYEQRRDALNVILKDGEQYTQAKVDELLTQFYKGGN